MKTIKLMAGACTLAFVVCAGPSLADDPKDPTMRSAEARARDAAIIRQLNRDQLKYVRNRDAQQRKGWEAYKAYPRQRAEYERRMADWRHAVRMCEAGRYEYCAR